MNRFLIFSLFLVAISIYESQCAVVSSSETGNEAINSRTARKDDGVSKKYSSKFLESCLERENFESIANCFGVKAIAVVNRASRMNTVTLLPGMSLVADEISQDDLQRSGRALSEEDIENSISAEPGTKSSKIADLLLESVSRFLHTHSLQFRLPKSSPAELERALDEGRAKLKKKFLPYLGILAVKAFAILPLLFGTLGFLALKALIVGKIALIIAAILALQKYNSGGANLGGWGGKITDGWSNPSGVSGWSSGAASSPAGYYRRSIDTSAHDLAYSAQIPSEQAQS